MSRKALLVVDMLNDFLDPDGALYCGDASREIIPHIRELIESHRRDGSIIIFVTDSHEADDKEFGMFPPHCVVGTSGSEMISEIEVRPEDYLVRKTRYSAFYGTELEDILRREGVDEVHLSGVCTSICVMDTTSDLWNRDFKAVVHQKSVADLTTEAHEFALKRMRDILGASIED